MRTLGLGMWNMECDILNVEYGMSDSGLGMWNMEWGILDLDV